ncbi:MAG: hypothetical protein AAGU77_14420, partial [Bacillota bacterium]
VRIGVNARLVVPPYCTCCMKPTEGKENIRHETPHDKLNLTMPVCAECKAHRSALKWKRIIQCDLAVLWGVILMSALLLFTEINAFLAFVISAMLVAVAHFIFGQALKVKELPAGHSSHEMSAAAVGGNHIAFTSFEYTMRFFGANQSSIPKIEALHAGDLFRSPLLNSIKFTSRYWLVSLVLFAGTALILGLGITLSGARPASTAAMSMESARPAATVSAVAMTVESASPTATVTARPTPTPFYQPVLSFPAGATVYYAKGDKLVPLDIETSADSDRFYYVVLADASTGEKAVAVYIEAGQTIEIDVPLGKYKLYYASGTVWYGNVYLFGPDGTCSTSNTTFNFYERGSFYYGHTVTLYPVSGEN